MNKRPSSTAGRVGRVAVQGRSAPLAVGRCPYHKSPSRLRLHRHPSALVSPALTFSAEQAGQWEQALEAYARMQRLGLPRNSFTYRWVCWGGGGGDASIAGSAVERGEQQALPCCFLMAPPPHLPPLFFFRSSPPQRACFSAGGRRPAGACLRGAGVDGGRRGGGQRGGVPDPDQRAPGAGPAGPGALQQQRRGGGGLDVGGCADGAVQQAQAGRPVSLGGACPHLSTWFPLLQPQADPCFPSSWPPLHPTTTHHHPTPQPAHHAHHLNPPTHHTHTHTLPTHTDPPPPPPPQPTHSPPPPPPPPPHTHTQVDQLLERMRRERVRFSHQAVSRLSGFCFSRGQPQVAYQLFKASEALLVGGGGEAGRGRLAQEEGRASALHPLLALWWRRLVLRAASPHTAPSLAPFCAPPVAASAGDGAAKA